MSAAAPLPAAYLATLAATLLSLRSLDLLHVDLALILSLCAATITCAAVLGSDPGYVARGVDSANANEGFCTICEQPKPRRAHHCRACNMCVHKFDHHCAVLNTCIGERNHLRFVIMLASHATVLWSYLLSLRSSATLNTSSRIDAFTSYASTAFLVSETALLTALLAFHTVLLSRNATGLELISSRGIDRNVDSDAACECPYSAANPLANLLLACTQDGAFAYMQGKAWRATEWEQPQPFDRESTSAYANPCNNRHYSCC